jgi:hypothetical protein
LHQLTHVFYVSQSFRQMKSPFEIRPSNGLPMLFEHTARNLC